MTDDPYLELLRILEARRKRIISPDGVKKLTSGSVVNDQGEHVPPEQVEVLSRQLFSPIYTIILFSDFTLPSIFSEGIISDDIEVWDRAEYYTNPVWPFTVLDDDEIISDDIEVWDHTTYYTELLPIESVIEDHIITDIVCIPTDHIWLSFHTYQETINDISIVEIQSIFSTSIFYLDIISYISIRNSEFVAQEPTDQLILIDIHCSQKEIVFTSQDILSDPSLFYHEYSKILDIEIEQHHHQISAPPIEDDLMFNSEQFLLEDIVINQRNQKFLNIELNTDSLIISDIDKTQVSTQLLKLVRGMNAFNEYIECLDIETEQVSKKCIIARYKTFEDVDCLFLEDICLSETNMKLKYIKFYQFSDFDLLYCSDICLTQHSTTSQIFFEKYGRPLILTDICPTQSSKKYSNIDYIVFDISGSTLIVSDICLLQQEKMFSNKDSNSLQLKTKIMCTDISITQTHISFIISDLIDDDGLILPREINHKLVSGDQ